MSDTPKFFDGVDHEDADAVQAASDAAAAWAEETAAKHRAEGARPSAPPLDEREGADAADVNPVGATGDLAVDALPGE